MSGGGDGWRDAAILCHATRDNPTGVTSEYACSNGIIAQIFGMGALGRLLLNCRMNHALWHAGNDHDIVSAEGGVLNS